MRVPYELRIYRETLLGTLKDRETAQRWWMNARICAIALWIKNIFRS
jgi:hypothetical protein